MQLSIFGVLSAVLLSAVIAPVATAMPGPQTIRTPSGAVAISSTVSRAQVMRTSPFLNPNPLAEIGSPSLQYLDPTSAVQPGETNRGCPQLCIHSNNFQKSSVR